MSNAPATPRQAANETLEAIAADHPKAAADTRVWVGDDGRARLYTSSRNFVEWMPDGTVRRSQPRIAWGHIVEDYVDAR